MRQEMIVFEKYIKGYRVMFICSIRYIQCNSSGEIPMQYCSCGEKVGNNNECALVLSGW